MHGEEDQDGEAGGSRTAATATGVGLAALAGDPGLEIEVAAVPASGGVAEGLGVPRTG